MWVGIGMVSGVVLIALSLFRLARRRSRQKHIDVGSVSESWLAEHRGRTSDSE